MGEVNKAFELILQYKGYFQRFADAEAALLDAARLEGVIEHMERALPRLKAEHDAAVAELADLQAELEAAMAQGDARVKACAADIERAEEARDKAIADAQALAAEVRSALAAENDALKMKYAAEVAALGKEVKALTAERDALLKALSELKRLAAR